MTARDIQRARLSLDDTNRYGRPAESVVAVTRSYDAVVTSVALAMVWEIFSPRDSTVNGLTM